MLVSWDQEFIADKNKIFKYGSIKLVIRFQKLEGGMFEEQSLCLNGVHILTLYTNTSNVFDLVSAHYTALDFL